MKALRLVREAPFDRRQYGPPPPSPNPESFVFPGNPPSQMHLMKVSARRKSRYGRAASEFFHAGLTFLCAHCAVGSLLAPSLRLFVSGLFPAWVEGAGADWAALEAAGGAGWPSWTAGSALLAGGEGADKGEGVGVVGVVGDVKGDGWCWEPGLFLVKEVVAVEEEEL